MHMAQDNIPKHRQGTLFSILFSCGVQGLLCFGLTIILELTPKAQGDGKQMV